MTFDEWWKQTKPAECDELKDYFKEAWAMALRGAISTVETYRVSVGNSRSGELAAEWTMANLKEIRDDLRRMADELDPPKVFYAGQDPKGPT